jgi:putative ABC transport system substrate-binding protein
MRRREFIAVLGGTAAAWPLAARAQRATMPVIGFLSSESYALWTRRLLAFHEGLGDTGYVEGRNVAIEYRWADGQNDRLAALAGDLVRRQVSVIAAASTPVGRVAKAATTTIPIVFVMNSDPVAAGLVASLNQPGGNLTGIVGLGADLGQKQLEMLHQLVPTATLIAVLINPTSPSAEAISKNVEASARTLGLQVHVVYASTEPEFDTVFATLAQLRAGALAVGADPFFTSRSGQLAALALRYSLPMVCQFREFVGAGGFISYGPNLTEVYRSLGVQTGRILKGTKPVDLPVEQITKIELIINMKTAKALGITVPLPLLGRADEVIE